MADRPQQRPSGHRQSGGHRSARHLRQQQRPSEHRQSGGHRSARRLPQLSVHRLRLAALVHHRPTARRLPQRRPLISSNLLQAHRSMRSPERWLRAQLISISAAYRQPLRRKASKAAIRSRRNKAATRSRNKAATRLKAIPTWRLRISSAGNLRNKRSFLTNRARWRRRLERCRSRKVPRRRSRGR